MTRPSRVPKRTRQTALESNLVKIRQLTHLRNGNVWQIQTPPQENKKRPSTLGAKTVRTPKKNNACIAFLGIPAEKNSVLGSAPVRPITQRPPTGQGTKTTQDTNRARDHAQEHPENGMKRGPAGTGTRRNRARQANQKPRSEKNRATGRKDQAGRITCHLLLGDTVLDFARFWVGAQGLSSLATRPQRWSKGVPLMSPCQATRPAGSFERFGRGAPLFCFGRREHGEFASSEETQA